MVRTAKIRVLSASCRGKILLCLKVHPSRHVYPALKSKAPKNKYPEWLLVLTDYIGYGLDEEDKRQFRGPRYLVNDLVNIMSSNYQSIDAKVIKVNPQTAPSQQRILVEISGVWPQGYEPMSSDDYQFIDS